MKLTDVMAVLEGFDQKRAEEGEVNFCKSAITDPHIQKAIQYISQQTKLTPVQIVDTINNKVAKMAETSKLVPELYKTMLQNAVESEVFNLIWQGMPDESARGKIAAMFGAEERVEFGHQPVGPKFSDRMLMELQRWIKADHDEFFPLRGFVDRRVQMNENWIVTPDPDYKQYNDVNTAAATPDGTFLFNRKFCQKLLDYATIKGIKGATNKYESHGGPIPDQYAYIEFLIIHELMHFSNDDFYYQHIIPGANPTIINWVGDFRSNYLLVKSGYAQLPIGLYNDSINYDRQSEYIQMYRIVEEEMKKLNPEQQEEVASDMNGQSDDHKPGQEAGRKSTPSGISDKSAKDIDKNAERIEREVGESANASDAAESGDAGSSSSGGEGGGGGSAAANQETNYDNVAPSFGWAALIKRFVGQAKPRTVETYAAPHRRNATGAVTISQMGASAIKPAEKVTDHVDISLMFVVDSSGSMSTAIAMAYSNISALLKMPQFKKSDCIVARFSSNFDLHKGNVASNRAAKIGTVTDKPKSYETTLHTVFNSHMGYSTNFKGQLITEIETAVKMKYSVLIFSDSDIFSGSENAKNLNMLIAKYPRNIFVLFNNRATYIQWRQMPGSVATPNISHM